MPRRVRRSTTFGASRRPGSRAPDDQRSRKRGRRAESVKNLLLPSTPVGGMRDRAGPFPRTQADMRRERPSSRGNLLGCHKSAPRVNFRENRARSAASKRGAVVCIGTTGSVVMNYGDEPTVVMRLVRQDTIVFWIPPTEKKHATSIPRSADPSAIRRMSEALPESRVLPNSYQDLL